MFSTDYTFIYSCVILLFFIMLCIVISAFYLEGLPGATTGQIPAKPRPDPIDTRSRYYQVTHDRFCLYILLRLRTFNRSLDRDLTSSTNRRKFRLEAGLILLDNPDTIDLSSLVSANIHNEVPTTVSCSCCSHIDWLRRHCNWESSLSGARSKLLGKWVRLSL
jgi:hypothetical protein